MHDTDLNKWKVAELRDELSARGLDTKGVKASLVKRLRAALNKEAREQQQQSDSQSHPSTADAAEEEHATSGDDTFVSADDTSLPVDQKDSDIIEQHQPQVETKELNQKEKHTGTAEVTEPFTESSSDNVQAPVDADKDLSNENVTDTLSETSSKHTDEQVDQTVESLHQPPKESSDIPKEGVKFSSSQELEKNNTSKTHDDSKNLGLDIPIETVKPPSETEPVTSKSPCEAEPVTSNPSSQTEPVTSNPPSQTEPSTSKLPSETGPETSGAVVSQQLDTEKQSDETAKNIPEEGNQGTEQRSLKRKFPDESEPPEGQEIPTILMKTEVKPRRERRTRWDTMKVEKEEVDDKAVTLDTYNSDLNLVIDAAGFSAYPLTDAGFAFMWSGARATHGITKGKICFEVMVTKHIDVSHLPEDEPNPHVVRVGFSVEDSTMQLGEDPLSYGYGGTGKISTNCQFRDYGTPFQAGDCITAFLNMDSEPVELGFAKNGRFAGWAYKINKNQLKGKALFPHVLTKNVSFEVNFGQMDKPFHSLPDGFGDYVFLGCVSPDLRIRGTRAPARREDCEMIMMCGLPGAGKSVWAAEYSNKHPEKKYNVLGTNNIIDKMKVMGLPRKRNYHGRWDVLIQMATKCLNKLFEIGSKLRRNFILDQTNVYPTAQRRKMRNFEGFKRKAVVVVPSEDEYKRRCDKRDREEGKEIPDHAVLEMKANFKLPEVCDIFDEVIFTELQRDEAEKLVRMYNEEGRAAVGPAGKRFKPQDEKSSPGGMQGGPPGGLNRGGRSSGGFDRDRRGRGGGGGGYNNSPAPRNSWGDRGDSSGSPGNFGGGGRPNNRGGDFGSRSYGGFDSGSSERGGRGGGGRGRGSFDGNSRGGRGGFDGSPGGRGGRGGFNGGSSGMRGGRGGFDSGSSGGRGGRGFDSGSPGSRGGRGGFGGGSPGGFGSRSPSGYGDYGGYGGSEGSPSQGGGYGDSSGGYGGGYGRGASRGGFSRGSGGGSGGGRSLQSSGPSSYGGYNEDSYGSGYSNDYRGGSSSSGGYGNDYADDQGGYGSSGGSSRGGYGSSGPSGGGYRKDGGGGGFGRGGGRGSSNSRGSSGYSGGNRGSSYGGGGSSGYSGGGSSYGGSGYGSDSGYGGPSSGGGSSGGYGGGSQSSGGYSGSGGGGSGGYGSNSSGGYGGAMARGGSNRGASRGGGSSNRGYSGAPARGSGAPRGRGGHSWSDSDHTQSDMGGQSSQVSTYSSYGSVKGGSEPSASAYSGYDQSYSSGYDSSSQGGYQSSYGYQATSQTTPAPVASSTQSQWSDPTPAAAPVAAAPAAVAQPTPEQIQQQWTQYYQQQQSQQQQYYSQYYGQVAAAAAAATTTPVYGTGAYSATK